MTDRFASTTAYMASAYVALAGLGVYEWTLIAGLLIAAANFLYNRHHKIKMAKQDLDFKLEALNIMREKQAVTVVEFPKLEDSE